MKIYTGTGDHGKTSLFSGERVYKYDHRIDACGMLDELNSVLGILVLYVEKIEKTLKTELLDIQNRLILAGAWVATQPDSTSTGQLKPFDSDNIKKIGLSIDKMETALPIPNAEDLRLPWSFPTGETSTVLSQRKPLWMLLQAPVSGISISLIDALARQGID